MFLGWALFFSEKNSYKFIVIRNKQCSLSSCQVLSMALSPFTSNLNKNSKHLFLETFLTVVEKSNLDHTTLTAFPSFQFLASAPSLSFNGAAQFFASALKQIGNMCFFWLITRVTCRLSYSIHALCSLLWTKNQLSLESPLASITCSFLLMFDHMTVQLFFYFQKDLYHHFQCKRIPLHCPTQKDWISGAKFTVLA